MTKAQKIGLAGLMGSGKSAVARILREWDFFVLDADREAHELYRESAELREKLARRFGEQVLTPEGVNRPYLGNLVFADPDALTDLEKLVHPELERRLTSKLDQLAEVSKKKAVFLEGALLPKWPALLRCLDQVWEIRASEDIRLERVARRGLEIEDARRRLAVQRDFPELSHPRTTVIKNDLSLEELRRKIRELIDAE